MKKTTISRIAVIVLAIVMGFFGIYHFRHPHELLVYVPNFLPGGILWVYFTGVAFIAVAIALLAHRFVKIAGFFLAILLLVFVLTIHLPNWLHAASVETEGVALSNMLKDMAIASFAAYVASNAEKI